MDCWPMSEWDMFMFIQNWICVDYENRISFVDELMSKVHFCLIAPEDLQAITEMDVYHETDGLWQDLVVNAVNYHQLPINLKVLDHSEQSEVKTEPVPVFLSLVSSQVELRSLNDEKKWVIQKQKGWKGPTWHDNKVPNMTFIVVVNNFLVVGLTAAEDQIWQIFDPRNMTWSTIANMEKRKGKFALVHHKDIFYTVGGEFIEEERVDEFIEEVFSCDMQQYSLLTNSWSSVHELPVPLFAPAACVLGDRLYVSGGLATPWDDTDGLYCLNLAANTREWETKAPCLWEVAGHHMCVLKRNGEDGLFIIDRDFNMQFYSPANDQWSAITNTAKPDGYEYDWLKRSTVFFRDNSVFILNMYIHERSICWKLTIPEEGKKISKVELQDSANGNVEMFGAMLAISPQNIN